MKVSEKIKLFLGRVGSQRVTYLSKLKKAQMILFAGAGGWGEWGNTLNVLNILTAEGTPPWTNSLWTNSMTVADRTAWALPRWAPPALTALCWCGHATQGQQPGRSTPSGRSIPQNTDGLRRARKGESRHLASALPSTAHQLCDLRQMT